LPDDILQTIRDLVNRPNGIFIVTGPTGSGKTTTLYSALREVNSVETKILTAKIRWSMRLMASCRLR